MLLESLKNHFAAVRGNVEITNITRIVQYDDSKLVDDMTVRAATAKMKALQSV